MPTYYKADRRAKAELGLWVIAIENKLEPEEVMWKCRGGCYKKTMRDPPMTKHIRVIYPSGTIKYTCMACGSGVLFDDEDESGVDLVDEDDRESFISDYRVYKLKTKSKLRKHK